MRYAPLSEWALYCYVGSLHFWLVNSIRHSYLAVAGLRLGEHLATRVGSSCWVCDTVVGSTTQVEVAVGSATQVVVAVGSVTQVGAAVGLDTQHAPRHECTPAAG